MAKKQNQNSSQSVNDQLHQADLRHYRDTEQYVGRVDRLYIQAIDDLSKLASQMQQLPKSQSFEFSRNPRLAAAADATVRTLAARIEAVVDAGCRHEWEAACVKGDQYVQRIHATSGFSREQIQRYQDRNLEALAAFQERKVDGLNLSERVWKMVSPIKDEVELAVDTSAKYFDHGTGVNTTEAIGKVQSAIGTGMSAADLSRDVRQCLLEPNKLFRRVKDKHGNLTLSKAAKLYHPGQGVYRSSYKNAMRLTRSEINMAYRQSDTMRWQQLDFVVGMEVNLSNNHTTTDPKGKGRLQLIDICDELKGRYPRDFKFVGWHPQCRCFMTPILKTREEMNEDRANADDPYYIPKPSVNAVSDTPEGFQQYMKDNAERIQGWKSTPYYIKDNLHYYDKALHPEKYHQAQDLALTAIQSKTLSDFQAYANSHQGSKKFAAAMERAQKAQLAGDVEGFIAAMKEMSEIQKTNERVAEYHKKKREQKPNPKELRHQFDERIDAIKAKAGMYPAKNISTKDITEAYANLDLARLEQAIAEQESIIKRHEAVLDAARRRHEARTDEQIKEITDEYHRRQNWYKAVRGTAKKTAQDAALDPWIERDMIAALDESKWLSHLDMLFAQQQTVRKMIDRYAKDRIAWRDFIGPDFDTLQTQYGHDDFKAAVKTIKTRLTAIGKKDLQTQEKLLDAAIQASVNDIYRSAYGSRLAIVRTDIKIQELTPDITAMLGASASTKVSVFKSLAQQAQDMLDARNVVAAEDFLRQAQAMKPIVDQYDALVALNYTTSKKFTAALQKGYDLLEQGDLAGAKQAFDEAALIKATNDANVARRNARNARAAQQKQEEAKEEKPKKLPGQAENIDEVRKIMGDDTPMLLKNYEESIARDQYTRESYTKEHETIEANLKAFFQKSKFTHCTDEDLLDERILDNGILTTHQLHDPDNKLEDGSYDRSRRSYEHFAYGLQDSRYRKVPKKERLAPGQYYRCGVPVPDDKTIAYKKFRSGYGDAQITLRKENIVTTFTYGNSLQTDCLPSMTNDPKVCSIDNHGMSAFWDKVPTHQQVVNDCSYIEIQYLPKSSEGRLMPKDMEAITLPRHPLKIIDRQDIWDRWYKEGVDIYYWDAEQGEVVLFKKGKPLESPEERKKRLDAAHAARKAKRDAELKKKGLTVEDKIQQLMATRAQMKVDAETKARDLLSRESQLVNADLGKNEFNAVEAYLKKGNVFGAAKKAREIEALVASQRAELEALKDLVPEYEKWHKQFTIEEIKIAHREIQKQINWIENKYEGRDDPDRVITKYLKVAQHVEHPELDRPGATRYKTWEIAKDAYMRKRDEAIYKYRKASIDENIARLRDFKTKDKDFIDLVKEIEQRANVGKWGDVEDIIVKAKEKMLELSTPKGEKILRLGESRAVRFSEEEYTEAKRNAARWFRAEDPDDDSQIRKAFKAADDYMSKYAQEMWSGLTQEEKQILWLYTDGSQYINQEMLGMYVYRVQSAIDGSIRNGLADANVITSVIERAPALKEAMWMQSGKSIGAIDAIFGTNLMGTKRNASSLVGLEGRNNLFMSCSASRDGAFTKGLNTGESNDVTLSIYMPKGTKGIYLEPIASYGDSKRGVEGYKWDGKKRRCAPSDQVEYLLQRGARFKITRAEYNAAERKWYIDVDLIEQPAVEELDTTIRGFDKRSIRYPRH